MRNIIYYPVGTREIRHRRMIIELTVVNETLILIEESALGETAVRAAVNSRKQIFNLIRYRFYAAP